MACGNPDDPSTSESIEQARARLAEGQPRAAVIALKNAIQDDPSDPEGRLLLGRAYLDLLQGAAAEAALRKARDLGMDSPEVLSGLGEALVMQGKYGEALSALEVRKISSPSWAAQLRAIRGDAALGLGDAGKARVLYGDALRSDPSNPRAQLGIARLALLDGQPDEARRGIQRVLDGGEPPLSAWTLLGDLELSEGRVAEAERAYGRAVDASAVPGTFQLKRAQARILLGDITGAREDLVAVKKTRARDHPEVSFTEGLLALRQGNLIEAQSALETALAADPGYTRATYALAVIHFKREQWARSAEYLSRIGADFPDGGRAKRMLAYARLKSGDLEGAERALEGLSAEAPEPESDLLGLLARIKLARGELDEGRALMERASDTDPSIKGLDVTLGLQLLRAGEVEAGLEQLEGTVERRPESARARRALFVARLQAGDRSGAQAVVDEMRSRWPDDALALVLQGVLDLAAGERASAKRHFGEALALDPANPAAASALAQLAIAEGQQERARELYAAVLDVHPDHVPTRIALAVLERRAGDEAAFEARLSDVLAENPGAVEPSLLLARHYLAKDSPRKALVLLREAEPLAPDNPNLLRELARSHLALGDVSSAKAASTRLAALTPKSAAARYLLAAILAQTGDRAGLKRELLAALDLDLSNPVSDGLINQLVSSSSTLDEANRVLEDLRGRYPDHPRFLQQRAQAAVDRGADDEALRIYRRGAELYPADARWTLRLSALYRKRGDAGSAADVLEARLAHRPEDLAVRLALANLYLGQGEGDEGRAETAFREVLARDPDNVPALNNLAWLLSARSPDEARGYAERAAELAPESPAVMDTLGLVLLRQGDEGELDRARRLLVDAVAQMPDSPEAKLHLAMAWSRSGEPAKAAALLEPLLATEDEFPGRAEAASLLERLKGERP